MSKQTIKIVLEALRAYRKRFAFDASLFNAGLADNPMPKNAADKIRQIDLAERELGGSIIGSGSTENAPSPFQS